MSTRKNPYTLAPIWPKDLIIGKYYTAIHFTDPTKDIEGTYLEQDANPAIKTIKNIVQTPLKDYVFYPISINRKMLKRFGIEVSAMNRNFPARNLAAYKAVPNYKRTLKSRRRSRKRVRRDCHSRFA